MSPRATTLTAKHVQYFLNHGPDASHFSWNVSRHLKLSTAKAAAKRLGTDKWVIIRAVDTAYKSGPRSVVAAGNAAYRNKAQAYVEKLNEGATMTNPSSSTITKLKNELAHTLYLAKQAPAEDRKHLREIAQLIRDRIKRFQKMPVKYVRKIKGKTVVDLGRNPRATNLDAKHVTYFLNTGPNASHFAWDVRRFKKLSEAKAAAKRHGNKWVIIRSVDLAFKAGPRSVVAAGSDSYRAAAERFCEEVNKDMSNPRIVTGSATKAGRQAADIMERAYAKQAAHREALGRLPVKYVRKIKGKTVVDLGRNPDARKPYEISFRKRPGARLQKWIRFAGNLSIAHQSAASALTDEYGRGWVIENLREVSNVSPALALYSASDEGHRIRSERSSRRSGLTGGADKKSSKAHRTPRDYGRNPMQNLNTVKAIGDFSVRLDGTQVIVYARGGQKLAQHYYPSEGTAQAGYRRLTSMKKIEAWIRAQPPVRGNPRERLRIRYAIFDYQSDGGYEIIAVRGADIERAPKWKGFVSWMGALPEKTEKKSAPRSNPRRNPSLPSTVVPGYGRDYKSAEAAIAAWEAGKDFIIADFTSPWDGKPISIRDFPAGSSVTIRYGKARKVLKYTKK